MNLNTLISDVRVRAADLGADRYPDKLIIEWVNQAYRDLSARLPIEVLKEVSTSSTIPMSATSGAVFDLPASFTQYVNALFDGNKCLRISQDKRTIVSDNVFYAAATADPYCIIWEDNIEVFPTPAGTATLTLYYIAKPTDMSGATDTPKLPDFSHALLVIYATARAMQELQKYQEAREYMQEYEAKIQEIRYLYAPVGPKESGRREGPGVPGPVLPPRD